MYLVFDSAYIHSKKKAGARCVVDPNTPRMFRRYRALSRAVTGQIAKRSNAGC
jgi:hypothetical protein